jgi:hypothetical protein
MMQDRLLNTLLLVFVSCGIWAPISPFGNLPGIPVNPINALVAFGIFLLVNDLADFQRTPRPKALIFGAFLAPFWPVIRRYAL